MEGSVKQTTGQAGAPQAAPFFVTAAHELKSPLALVRQLSLAIEAGDCTSKELETIARQITLTSERALRLTTNLTKTAHLEDSLFTLEPLNPVTVCEDVVREISPLYRAQGRQITFTPRSKPLLGLANRDLLRRVLLNFVDNALHYADTDTPVVVSASARDGGTVIRLGVRDYGPAIPANMWQRIEDSLAGHGQVFHARPESSGLGMYIARQFAAAMHASIGTTRHHDGATFYIDIGVSTQLRLL